MQQLPKEGDVAGRDVASIASTLQNRRARFLRRLAPRTLFGRISLAFFLLMAAAGTAQIFATVYAWDKFNRTSSVELYRASAAEIARQIEPELPGAKTEADFARILFRFTSVCPELLPYLVTADGEVFGAMRQANFRKIDVVPIAKFLHEDGGDDSLIWGDDPVGEKKILFSAAPLVSPRGPAFVYVVLTSDSSILRHSVGDSSVLWVGILFAIVAFGGTVLLGLLVFRQLTARYRTTSVVLRQFAAGDYSVRIDEGGADEVMAQAQAFNRMADTIVRTIAELERVDASRRALVATVSHDLRRPLTTIHLAVERLQLRAGRLNDPGTGELAEDARRGCIQLEQLVTELFELSLLEAGTKLKITECDLSRLFSKVFDSLKHVAIDRGIDFSLSLPDDSGTIRGDEERLLRLLGNLCQNAIEYSERGGKVQLIAENRQTHVVISVVDNGPGISPADIPSLFDYFFRGSAGVLSRPGGTGLGLSICKRIAELHGSTIQVQSTVGKGSTFSFELQRSKSTQS